MYDSTPCFTPRLSVHVVPGDQTRRRKWGDKLNAKYTCGTHDAIFIYDTQRPIYFFVDRQDRLIISLIEQYGGRVVDLTRAHFRIGHRSELSVAVSGLPVVDPVWVKRSVKDRILLPMYNYVEEPQHSSLHYLSPDQRDTAELIKALSGHSVDTACRLLHENLPHRTTNSWRMLYSTSRDRIDAMVMGLKSRIGVVVEEASNEVIFSFFSSSPTKHRSLTSSSGSLIKNISPMTNSSPIKRMRHSVEPDDFIVDDDDGLDDMEELAIDHSPKRRHYMVMTPRARVRPKGASGVRRVRMTPSDVNAMVRFVHKLGREPTTIDWQDFYEAKFEHQTRTPAAWNTQYRLKRDLILESVKILSRKKERSPSIIPSSSRVTSEEP